MDTVGFTMALGNGREKLEGYINQDKFEQIWDFIEANYDNISHYTR